MQENTNNAIVYNSAILYSKMLITTVCSLLTTRYALQALGIIDFGLFSLLGGIISFVSLFNNIMLTTSNRFIAVAIGRGNMDEVNSQFNVNLVVHVIIAVLTAIISFPVGMWYIYHFVNYAGDIHVAILVFNISIGASIFSFVGVPYNGLLMAKEKFIVFSSVDIVSHVLRTVVAYLLITHFNEKLFLYTLTMGICTVFPVFIYVFYCKAHYPEIVKLRLVRCLDKYREIFKFSLWVSIGAVAMISKSQGAALLVNAFFNTIMNTALGIANSVCAYLNLFSQTVTQPMAPQITKSYAANKTERTNELLLMSTKYAYLLMLIASSPFLVSTDWLLNLWLGQVPPFAKEFLILIIIDGLILSLNSGISNVIFASGNIKGYQIMTSCLNILSVLVGFILLWKGLPAYCLFVIYIFFSLLRVLVIQWILYKEMGYNNSVLIKGSYLPCLRVTFCFIPISFITPLLHPIVWLIVSFIYLCVITYVLGLSDKEKIMVKIKVKTLI